MAVGAMRTWVRREPGLAWREGIKTARHQPVRSVLFTHVVTCNALFSSFVPEQAAQRKCNQADVDKVGA